MNVSWSVPPYLLHPLFVHFPIALLVLGLGVGLVALKRGAPNWLKPASETALAGGTLFLWLVVALGLLAERTAPHVPPAWQVLLWHKRLGFTTTGLFTVLTLAWWFNRKRPAAWPWILGAWTLALVVLVLTAHLGSTLVFTYGMGSPPS
ncbi:MAG: DUF2231 domain-containing protein [bacterium]